MSNPASILVFGLDPGLLQTRRLMLQSTGGVVHATAELAEAERILDRLRPELVVLCYTLAAEERAVLKMAVERLGGGIRTLTLTADGRPEISEGDHDIFAGAKAFKMKVMDLLSRDVSFTKQQCH